MANVDILDILKSKQLNPFEFEFDNLYIPPMNYYLTQQDIDELHGIATSIRLSSKIRKKYEMIDQIMIRRGFKRFSAGTNRVVYKFLEDDRFLAKIAVDKVGMQDNPLEFKNQFLLKPYVTKIFYISQCGTVAFTERVLPIKNKLEFKEIASDVFDIIVNKILGLYVMEDIGTKYFMNWGVRFGFGPVLLDFPYCYKLDGKKLYCNSLDPITKMPCNGEIDYDSGFNHLVCTKCGKVYLATDLRDNSGDNRIIIKGGNEMKVIRKIGNRVLDVSVPTEEVIKRVNKPTFKKVEGLVVKSNIKVDEEEITESPKLDVSKETKEEVEVMNEETSDTSDSNEVTEVIEDDYADINDPEDDVDAEERESATFDTDTQSVIDENLVSDNDMESFDKEKYKPVRDSKGRFISTGGNKKYKKNKTGSTFIPNRD